MNKVSKSLIVLFLAFLLGGCFEVYFAQAQNNGLILEVVKKCDVQYSGDSCIAEFKITNNTGKVLDGTAFFDVDYNGVCGNYFEEGGIDAWYDNQVSKMEWNDGSKKFVSANFEIPNGLSKANLEIYTSSALCPGEYTFNLELKGTFEEKEYITLPVVLAVIGGSSGGITSLIISNEENGEILSKTASVSWFTNKLATGRVIYDIVSHPEIGSSSNYGYAYSTVENTNKVTFHTIIISGLTPGTEYFWRAVSSASPEVLGYELSFTIEIPAPAPSVPTPSTPTPTPLTPAPTSPVSGIEEEEPTEEVIEPEETESEEVAETEEIESKEEVAQTEDKTNSFLAAISGLFGGISSCLILSLFLTLFLILYLMYRRRKEKRDKNNGIYKEKKYYWDLIGIFIIFIILMFLLKCYFLLLPIIITIGYWLYDYFKKDSSL